jgi:copper transport protein
VAFWAGALLPLAVAMRNRGEAGGVELARFSRAIVWPFVMLIATGSVLAVVQLRTADSVWTTAYGAIFAVKLAAVLVLIGLAAHNRRLTPRAVSGEPHAVRMLGRSVLAEIVLVIVVLGLVASWRFTPPPRALIDAAAAPVQVHIHTERAMADVTIARNRAGGRLITLTILDGQFGPLAAKEVALVLSHRAAGIEPLRLRANHVEATIWRIEDVRLPLAGRWQASVEILVNDFEKVTIEHEVDLPR